MLVLPHPQDAGGNRVPVREFTIPTSMEPPVDGVTLAGIAAPGDRLTVYPLGVFTNVGTLERPVWQKQG